MPGLLDFRTWALRHKAHVLAAVLGTQWWCQQVEPSSEVTTPRRQSGKTRGWQEGRNPLCPPDPGRKELQVDEGRSRGEGTGPWGSRPSMG